jgi:uncharacterized SAM-binding protein YcdF (DUF218 family)
MQPGKFIFRHVLFILIPLILGTCVVFFSEAILRNAGSVIVVDEKPSKSDAVIVLNTGDEYYPRLIQAADLYRLGLAEKVVINGNRKTDTLRMLEAKGFENCCPWYADSVRILSLLAVPEKDIIWISAEDAYDSMSEAAAVGKELIRQNLRKVIITTSKFHTRRAKFIWKKMYVNQLNIVMVSAKMDPFDPAKWWQDGRQIRWVLAEYGAWVYYWWKSILGITVS